MKAASVILSYIILTSLSVLAAEQKILVDLQVGESVWQSSFDWDYDGPILSNESNFIVCRDSSSPFDKERITDAKELTLLTPGQTHTTSKKIYRCMSNVPVEYYIYYGDFCVFRADRTTLRCYSGFDNRISIPKTEISPENINLAVKSQLGNAFKNDPQNFSDVSSPAMHRFVRGQWVDSATLQPIRGVLLPLPEKKQERTDIEPFYY